MLTESVNSHPSRWAAVLLLIVCVRSIAVASVQTSNVNSTPSNPLQVPKVFMSDSPGQKVTKVEQMSVF